MAHDANESDFGCFSPRKKSFPELSLSYWDKNYRTFEGRIYMREYSVVYGL